MGHPDKKVLLAILNVQLFLKVSTPLQDEPLVSMSNVMHGIGYSSSDTTWITKLRLPTKYTSIATETQRADLELGMGLNLVKLRTPPPPLK